MKIHMSEEHNFGEVYVVAALTERCISLLQVVEVYEQEVHALERQAELEREGYRLVKVERRMLNGKRRVVL